MWLVITRVVYCHFSAIVFRPPLRPELPPHVFEADIEDKDEVQKLLYFMYPNKIRYNHNLSSYPGGI